VWNRATCSTFAARSTRTIHATAPSRSRATAKGRGYDVQTAAYMDANHHHLPVSLLSDALTMEAVAALLGLRSGALCPDCRMGAMQEADPDAGRTILKCDHCGEVER